MQVSAEYNSTSCKAFICELDRYYTIKCTMKCFVSIILAFQNAYGKMSYKAVGKDGVFVTFGGAL